MAHAPLPLYQRGFGETMRRDAWWIQPVVVVVLLGAFLLYANWAAWQNANYTYGPYLSPFYSPVLWGDTRWAWFGPKPAWWPHLLPFSPALIILPFPGIFRLTCYYYRGAYYKAFWADPPSCTVGEPRKSYLGERHFPLIVQNIHRYFLYIGIIFLVILAHDVWAATQWSDANGVTHFGVGVGTIVLAVNVVLLSCYAFGCHSLRHIVGGYLDELAKRPARKVAYDCASCLNRWHMRWAWSSLFSVAFADFYIRMCAMGIWHDVRLF